MSIEHFFLSDPDFLLWRSELKVMFLQRLKCSLIFIILAIRKSWQMLESDNDDAISLMHTMQIF